MSGVALKELRQQSLLPIYRYEQVVEIGPGQASLPGVEKL